MKNKILDEYDKNQLLFKDFVVKMEHLVKELIKSKELNIHYISGRLKERQSLENKLIRKDDRYKELNEITDIVGIRIITYLESDIDAISTIIEKELKIDKENSIDKSKKRVDEFGYKSKHYIVGLNEEREKLVEYQRFKNLKFEIQIRSILQHAWAEIEHDLGYKGLSTIPDSSKRTFNRLSALLEMADIEFDRLNQELIKYENEVEKLIENEPENVNINQASLNSFNLTNRISKEVRNIVYSETKCTFTEGFDYKNVINILINFFQINTIEELTKLFVENEILYLKFVKEFIKNKTLYSVPNSVGIFYFLHFLSAKDEDEIYMEKYLNFTSMNLTGESFVNIIKKSKNQ